MNALIPSARRGIAAAVGLLSLCHVATAAPSTLPPSASQADPTEARVAYLLAQMTLPEKLSLLALRSDGNPDRLDTPAISRLGIPPLRTSDATEGLRIGQATCFPMEAVMAATWDPSLVGQVGAAIGQEAKAKGREVIYGPDVNIQRSPQGGRYSECFSEDPYLVSRMAVAYIEGMQGQGVASCVKHFICNDQEAHRHDGDIIVGQRTLREIYLPPFEAALRQAHAWALMPALGEVNGAFMAQNVPLLRDLVLDDWDWDGVVISDWGAVHATVPAVRAGTDIEMPNPRFFRPAALQAALSGGAITEAQVDDMDRRVLRALVRTDAFHAAPTALGDMDDPAHRELARKVAQEGIILLKNAGGLLPLDRAKTRSIAVIGPNAADTQDEGRWSADVHPYRAVGVLEGLQDAAGPRITVKFAQGCPRTDPMTPQQLHDAVALASTSDVAVVVVGTDNNYVGEELDTPDINLPGDQAKLIQAVAAVNRHTIVILNAADPVLMTPWLPRVSGLLEMWYAGEEQGDAIADLIFGKADPSGKLTGTLAARREDYSDYGHYPGNGTMAYTDGIYVGYRHFDRENITPLFPFGFGLSYTTFGYSNLHVPARVHPGQTLPIEVTVRNTGHRAGDEIIEVYVRPLDPPVDRPVRTLAGFQRVSLAAGRSATVTVTLDPSAFADWDVWSQAWTDPPGDYEIEAASSSRDIRLRGVVRLLPQ